MWDTISRADIASAKAQLRSRREGLIRRHAEELRAVKEDEAEIAALEQLISAFTNTFNIVSSRETSTGGHEGTSVVENSDGVSFFITQAQKLKLRELGIGDDRIRNMKPREAHQILGLAS